MEAGSITSVTVDEKYINTFTYDEEDWDILLEPICSDKKDIYDSVRKIHLSAGNVPNADRFIKVDRKTKTVSATGSANDPSTIWISERWDDGNLQFITDEAPAFIMYVSNWKLMARERNKKMDDNDDSTKFNPKFSKPGNHCLLESKSTPGLFIAFDHNGKFLDQRDTPDCTNTIDKHLLFQVFKR